MSEAPSYVQSSSQRAAAGNWTQDGRLIALETPLGKDKLLLTSLAGEETISRLFAYELEMLSADHAISPESLIGRNVKVVITSEDGKTRPIHGMVAQFRAGPLAGRELRQYSALVVPWLWYLRAQHRLPHLPEPERSRHHRPGLQDLRLHRLSAVGRAR